MMSTVPAEKPKCVTDVTKTTENEIPSKMEQNEIGGKHKSEKKGRCKSICWSLTKFLISLGLLIFGSFFFFLSVIELHSQMNDYRTLIVKNVIDFPNNITLPAITICNNNRVQKTKLCGKVPWLCEKYGLNVSGKYITTHPDFQFLHEMPTSDLVKMGQSISDLVLFCYFFDGGRDLKKCGYAASQIYYQPRINCFTFHFHNDTLHGHYMKTGFWLNLNFQPKEYTEEFVPVGGRVYLHDENEKLPIVGQGLTGYPIKPGFSYNIAVKRTTYHRLPPPYETGCKDYSKYSEGTSQKECYNECLIKNYIKRCECQPISLAYSKLRDREIICNNSRKTPSGICYHNYKEELEALCDEFCPLACQEDKYQVKSEVHEIMEMKNGELKKDERLQTYLHIIYHTNEHENIYYTPYQANIQVKCGMLCLWAFLILLLIWLTFREAKRLCTCSK